MKSQLRRIVAAAVLSPALSQAALTVLVSPNDIETAEASGIIGVTSSQIFTEDFNSVKTGSVRGYVSSSTGVTYTAARNAADIKASNQYGGYNQGNYLGINANNSTTMTLAGASQYFGFYFTAGDANNQIEIYSGNTKLLTFSTATLIAMLPNTADSKITAINGTQYLTRDYYGKPVTGVNATEPYAYLHFVATGATSFDKIVLSQGATSIFENDNHSILTATPVIPKALVYVTGDSMSVLPIPEPSGALLAVTGLALLACHRRRG